MKSYILTFFIIAFTICNAQKQKRCKVYQYSGNDSINKTVELVKYFDAAGNLVTEKYGDYKFDCYSICSNDVVRYKYKHGLLVKKIGYSGWRSSGNRYKTIYTYNAQYKLIKEVGSSYEKRLKEQPDNELRPTVCMRGPDAYKKKKTWQEESTKYYTYNDSGLLTETSDPLEVNSDSKYIWTYDSLGRIKTVTCKSQFRKLWLKEYSYFDKGYQYFHTSYDYDGNPIQKIKGLHNIPQFTVSFTLDEKGHVLNKTVSDDEGKILEMQVNEYDAKGRLVKERYTNTQTVNIPAVTHEYVYYYK